ncbi:fluoride efflux transporter FluC [Enterococcus sp. CSURQ0835]|uniref:fluoride efflux transporter FluC n=1 Tax=Enterococcus sp. CSURQ0835 TaxID=2681394 RepID=UPI0013574EEB|nr:CrcB family protein [Enterococcus sp. CSURQ0835]
MDYLVIALFAFCGGAIRFLVSEWLPKIGGVFPLATLVVNLIGCLFFSWVVKHILSDIDLSARLVLGIGVGFCGALTTFSSFALDVMQLVLSAHYWLALLYFGLSLAGGLGLVFLGESLYQRKQVKL